MNDVITNCRGDEKKRELCKCYEIKAISRMALLPGQTIEGCCGDLENQHTIFSYKHKSSGKEGVFSVGKDCADAFLAILKQPLPPLVNPLKDMKEAIATLSKTQGNGSSGGGAGAAAIPKINLELYEAVTLWCILNKKMPLYALQRILIRIQTDPTTPLTEKDVFDFVKVLASYKKSLKELLDDARKNNPNVKNYTFPHINDIVSKNWIDLPRSS